MSGTNGEYSKKPSFKNMAEFTAQKSGFKLFTPSDRRFDKPLQNILTVILAGGKARRFGGKNKALIKIGAESIIERLLKEIPPQSEVAISLAKTSPTGYEDYKIIRDNYEDCGPIGAIATAFEETDAEVILFLPCDMPFINKESCILLFEAISSGEYDAALSSDEDGKIHPLFCAVKRTAFPLFKNAIEQKRFKLISLFTEMNTCYIPLTSAELININTEEDFHKAVDFYGEQY